MTVIYISSEVVPYAKTGGLADVVGILPKVITKLGHLCAVILPKYKKIQNKSYGLKLFKEISVPTFKGILSSQVFQTSSDGVPVYFIDFPEYFDRDELYGTTEHGDYPDNLERFVFFSRASIELLRYLDDKVDIVHCHDWQTALVPVYLKTLYSADPKFNHIKSMFTIHNLAYQGLFGDNLWHILGLDSSMYTPDNLEFWGKINLMKGGLIYSDIITTVSNKYKEEIQTEEYGCGLEGVLRERASHLHGIVNGIDINEWNPEKDDFLYGLSYSKKDQSKKSEIKANLQKEFNIEVDKKKLLIGVISRLADQKGFDLIVGIFNQVMEMEPEVQFVLLGTGQKKYHDQFTEFASQYKGRIGVHLGFSNELAHRIEAGVDVFLMPSNYEPCGLNQLYSLRYGTLPLVRHTGGLADTIKDSVNGFSFTDYTPNALLQTLERAARVYYTQNEKWQSMIKTAMGEDWSWEASATKYISLYKSMLAL